MSIRDEVLEELKEKHGVRVGFNTLLPMTISITLQKVEEKIEEKQRKIITKLEAEKPFDVLEELKLAIKDEITN